MMLSRRRELERRIESSGLPQKLRRLVVQTVSRTRLWRRERRDVAEELIAHFLDGLGAERGPSQLAAEFGDPGSAAALITRARRRMRPLAWQAWIVTFRAGALVVTLALAAYALSAFRLYSAAPAVAPSARPTDERALPPEPYRGGMADRTLLSWSNVWPAEVEAVAAEVARARRLLNEARRAVAEGDPRAGFESLFGAVAEIDGLRATGTLPGELMAVALRTEVVEVMVGIRRDAAARPAGEAGREEARLLAALRAQEPVRIGPVREGLSELLDRVYAADGRLTGRGLRLLQALAGKMDPGLLAMALEPAYFSFPADRDEVARELDRLLALLPAGERGPGGPQLEALRGELSRLRESPLTAIRLIPIGLVMPAVLDAATRASRTQQRLERLAATSTG